MGVNVAEEDVIKGSMAHHDLTKCLAYDTLPLGIWALDQAQWDDVL